MLGLSHCLCQELGKVLSPTLLRLLSLQDGGHSVPHHIHFTQLEPGLIKHDFNFTVHEGSIIGQSYKKKCVCIFNFDYSNSKIGAQERYTTAVGS